MSIAHVIIIPPPGRNAPNIAMNPIGDMLNALCARRNNRIAQHPRNRLETGSQRPDAVGRTVDTRAGPTLPESFHLQQTSLISPQPRVDQNPIQPFFPNDFGFNNVLNSSWNKAAAELMEDAFAKGTIGNYASALNSFTNFCEEQNIPKELRFPTDERVLCAFVTSLNRTVSGSTAKAMFTSLRRWHDMHHMPWNGSERLTLMVRGVKNNTPAESKRPKRIAITPKMMVDLDSALDHNDPKDCAILACAKTAFFGQARLGELLATSRLKHNPATHPSRHSIIILLNANAREIRLPRTKTHQSDGESIYLTRQSDPLDPVKALEDHLRINHGLADSDHIFAYRSSTPRSGRHSLTNEDFMKRVNGIWSALGYQRVTGHSFRIGGTTTLLRNGVPPDVVKELGRWSSDAFHIYWRDIPEIATRHVQFLPLTTEITRWDSLNNTDGQVRRPARPSGRHDGQDQRHGRPAYRPY